MKHLINFLLFRNLYMIYINIRHISVFDVPNIDYVAEAEGHVRQAPELRGMPKASPCLWQVSRSWETEVR